LNKLIINEGIAIYSIEFNAILFLSLNLENFDAELNGLIILFLFLSLFLIVASLFFFNLVKGFNGGFQLVFLLVKNVYFTFLILEIELNLAQEFLWKKS